MKGDANRIYSRALDFFELDGNFVMVLTPDAAEDVCQTALSHDLIVGRIEGGHWLGHGFEPSINLIWDGLWPPPSASLEDAKKNNEEASAFVRNATNERSAFVLSLTKRH